MCTALSAWLAATFNASLLPNAASRSGGGGRDIMKVAKLHPNQLTMYLWRRRATPQWWLNHEESLRARFGGKLAVIERPNRTQLEIEVVCNSRILASQFGGRIAKLPRDWLKRFSRPRRTR